MKISSPPEFKLVIKKHKIKVKHDVSLRYTGWKVASTGINTAIVTYVFTEVCLLDSSRKGTILIQ